mgnify:CR=1 FL=1
MKLFKIKLSIDNQSLKYSPVIDEFEQFNVKRKFIGINIHLRIKLVFKGRYLFSVS